MCVFLSYRWVGHYSKTITSVALGKENVSDTKLEEVIPLFQFCAENVDEKFLKQNCTLILNSLRQTLTAFIKLRIIAGCRMKMCLFQLMSWYVGQFCSLFGPLYLLLSVKRCQSPFCWPVSRWSSAWQIWYATSHKKLVKLKWHFTLYNALIISIHTENGIASPCQGIHSYCYHCPNPVQHSLTFWTLLFAFCVIY